MKSHVSIALDRFITHTINLLVRRRLLLLLLGYGVMANSQPVSAADCVPAPSGLVSWWPGDSNASDIQDSNHGTLQNGAMLAAGKVGQAFSFDGVDDVVLVADAPNLQFGPTSPMTVDMWVFRTSSNPGQHMIGKRTSCTGSPTEGTFQLFLDMNTGAGLGFGGPSDACACSGQDLPLNTWTHLAGTFDGTTLRLFINGQVAATTPGSLGPANTAPLKIGDSGSCGAFYGQAFGGLIDEVSLYNRALSTNEIQTIYAAGSAGKCVPAPPPACAPASSGLISWWRAEGNGWDSVDTNSGSVLNGASYADGKVGQALSLDGVDDHFRVSDQPKLRLTTGLTVEAWIYPTSIGGNHVIVSKWDAVVGPEQRSYSFSLQPGGLAYLAVSPNGGTDYTAVYTHEPVPVNQWTHLAVTYDGAALRIYRNGLLDNETPYTGGIFPGKSDLGVGANVGGTAVGDVSSPFAALFAGLIDEVSIYNRALSVGEIAVIYNANSAGKCVSPPLACQPPPAGLVSWWSGQGNANDLTGANPGTLQNGAGFESGQVATAFNFDAGAYVRVGAAPSLTMSNAFSVELWLYPTGPGGAPTYGGILINKEGQYEIARFADGTIQWAVVSPDNPVWNWVNSGFTAPEGQWTHLAWTYDFGTSRLFANGQLVQTYPGSGPVGSLALYSPNEFWIGNRQVLSTSQWFQGRMDEISVYNRALSGAEIQAIFAAGSAGKCVVTNPPPVSPVIASQPTNATVYVGSNATFRVTATGTAPLRYQWRLHGNDLPGKTGILLSLTSVQFSNAGPYSVVVSNAGGSITSSPALLTVNPLPDCASPPAGLVSWWRAEKTANDDWDSNNGTTPFGLVTTSGKVGSAFNFIDTSRYILVNDAPSLHFTNAITVEAWVNPSTAGGTAARTIVSKFDYASRVPNAMNSSFFFGTTNNGRPCFVVSPKGSPVTNATLVVAQPLPANQWSFLAATYDGAALRLYVNGELAAQTNYAGGIFAGTSAIGIGALPYIQASVQTFHGLIDEISLYNRALTDGEIQAIYNADLVGKCLVAPTIVTQPQDQAIPLGEDVKFSASVFGSRPLKYQWRFNNAVIAGATNAALVLEKVQTNRVGNYSVFVSNAVGTATSSSATLTLLPAPVCAETPAGLISWWPGDNNLFDAMGANNIATFSPTLYVTGKVARAFSFNGLSSRILVNSPASLNFGSNADFAIETWIKVLPLSGDVLPIRGPNSTNTPIIEKRSVSGSTGIGYSLSLNAGRLAFWLGSAPISSTNGSAFISSGPDLRDAMFHHVAVSLERNSTTGGRLYVDGQLVLTFDPTPRRGDLSNTGALLIGAPTSPVTGLFFSGLIDEPAIYKRALTAEEIFAIRQAGAAGKCKVKPSILVQPVSQRVTLGSNVTFSVTAVGTPLLRYQWSPFPVAVLGATNSSYSFIAKSGGAISVRVTNLFGSVTSSNATLTINNPPFAGVSRQPLSLPEDTTVTFGTGVGGRTVSAGGDKDNDPLTFIIVSPPLHGSITLTGSNMVYQPTPNFNGEDSFSYKLNDGLADSNVETVRLNFWPVNDPPVALSQLITTDEDTAIPITLGAFDADGDALTYSVTPPAHGTLSGVAPNLNYTPATNYFGSDLFTFTVMDPSNAVSQLAAVSITVRPVNDAPVARIEVAPLDELPGITNLVSIAPVCCEATLRLDASKSTDVENDALTYTWLEGTNILSTEVVVTNRFKPGTHEFTLLVNDGKDVTAASVTVEIITSAEAVAFLKGLVEAGIPEHRDRVPLVNWLREAGKAFDRCKVDQGVKFLELFNQRVQDRIAPTDAELATALMETATAIIEAAPDCDPCHRLGRHHHKREEDKERDGRGERDEHDKTGHDERDPGSRSERGDRTDRPGARATDTEVRVERSSPGSR